MLTPGKPFRGYEIKELQRCAEREAQMRRQVYKNRVMKGTMSQRQADAEIDKMAAIAEHLAELAAKDRLL